MPLSFLSNAPILHISKTTKDFKNGKIMEQQQFNQNMVIHLKEGINQRTSQKTLGNSGGAAESNSSGGI